MYVMSRGNFVPTVQLSTLYPNHTHTHISTYKHLSQLRLRTSVWYTRPPAYTKPNEYSQFTTCQHTHI